MHKQEFPEMASQIVKNSYMDDLRLTASDKQELEDRMQEADKIQVMLE